MTIRADQLRLSTDLEEASGALRIATAAVGSGLTGGGGSSISFDTTANITTTGAWDYTGGSITVPAPSVDADAATKKYVDDNVAGITEKVKPACRVASTADVATTYTSTNGASARGQHTGAPNTLDGVSLAQDDRILLKDQSPGDENGIWVVTTLGSGSDGVWDRATDFDADEEVTSAVFVFIKEGTANDDKGFMLTNADPIVIGGASSPTVLVWAQFTTGALADDSIDPNHLNFEWRALEITASSFSFSATRSTLSLSGAALSDAAIDFGNMLFKNGVMDQELVTTTAATNEWSISGTTLSVHGDITASGDLYQLQYLVATGA